MTVNEIRRKNINTWADKLGRNLLAQKLGYPDTNYVNQLCSGSGSFGSRTARKIEKALNLPEGWMDIPHEIGQISEVSPDYTRNKIDYSVPLIGWHQVMQWLENDDNKSPGDAEDWMPRLKDAGPNTFALTVTGDTMVSLSPGQRSYPHGTIIYVDPDKEVANGARVVGMANGQPTFKTYIEDAGRKYLKPINTSYDKIDITDDPQILGVVIGSYMSE